MLQLIDLHKTFDQPSGRITVLNGIDFHLDAGQSAALLGESGSGKSTLLHLAAGLDHPDHGDIRINGQSTRHHTEADWAEQRRNHISLVFQQFHLIPTLTVLDNVRLQARLCGRTDADYEHQLLHRLGLATLTHRLPHQLSGGQQQRVAIARALLHRPPLVLADEPTGNLDEHSSESVMALFVDLVRDAGCTLLMVTHSATMAAYLDQRWRLHDGTLSREGTVV